MHGLLLRFYMYVYVSSEYKHLYVREVAVKRGRVNQGLW